MIEDFKYKINKVKIKELSNILYFIYFNKLKESSEVNP
jgi:hypothetical protein